MVKSIKSMFKSVCSVLSKKLVFMPKKCDRCKCGLEKKYASVVWAGFNYVFCLDCFKYYYDVEDKKI